MIMIRHETVSVPVGMVGGVKRCPSVGSDGGGGVGSAM